MMQKDDNMMPNQGTLKKITGNIDVEVPDATYRLPSRLLVQAVLVRAIKIARRDMVLKNLARSIAILGLSWALASANVQAQCASPPSLDGLWSANDGGTYQVRIVGTDVWWIGR